MLTSWPHRSLLVFAMLTVSAVAARAAEETVLLRPKFKTGQAYYVERISDSENVLTGGQFGSAGTKNTSRFVLGVVEKTREADRDRTIFSLTFRRAAYRGTSAGLGELDFDSAKEEDDRSPMLAPILRPLIGMTVTLHLDRDFTAVKVTGAEKLIAKVERGRVAGNMLWPQFREILNNEALRELLGTDQFALLPNREVKVGERWQRSFELPGIKTGPVRAGYEVVLDKVSTEAGRRLAHLSYTGTLEQVGPSGPKGPAEYQLESGTFRGTATFDCELGRIVRCEEDQKKTLHVTIPGAGASGQIKVTSETKLTMSLSPAQGGAKKKSGDAAKKKSARKKSSTKKNTVEKRPSSADDE